MRRENAGGDAYACYARHIAANDNASGRLANWWLDGAIDDLEEDKSQCIDRDRLKRNIRKGLAERYANYLPQDANRRRWPTKQGVSQIHWTNLVSMVCPPIHLAAPHSVRTVPILLSLTGARIAGDLPYPTPTVRSVFVHAKNHD